MEQKPTLPNATATLVLGICSIVMGCVYVGLILGIVGLAISAAGNRLYRSAPDEWSGYGMLNAGRILSIIGIVFSSIWIIWVVIVALFIGAAATMGAFPYSFL